ncbi:MAG: hypothetical protein FNP40_00155 [Dehalobacter sp. 4CP]|nr:hypothetical protein [Dehalobacter sp. 4CP]
MDQNLTGLITANVFLSQTWYALVINALIGPLSALIGAGGVFYVTQRSHKHEEFMKSLEINQIKRQERRNLIAELQGTKKLLTQLYFSSYEAMIHSRYYQQSIVILENQRKSKDDFESSINEQRYWKRYWIKNGNDISIALFKQEKQLFRVVGLISLSFPKTEKLNKLLDKVNEMEIKTLIPPDAQSCMDFDQLEAWKWNATINLDSKVKEEYLAPINDLISFLKYYLEKESMKTGEN